MHYLVTGGAGFIGSHLCDALLAAGHRVSVIDNLSTGKRENLAPAVNFHEGDCADVATIAPLVAAADGVFHLAAIASVQQSCEAWSLTSRTNQFATIALLEAIAKRPIPFVYASSAATYGDPDASYLPLKESTPTQPLTPYGADKLGSELHARAARHVFRIPTLGLRFFNVYGSRQDPSSPYSGVISIFMRRIGAGQPITIFGDGKQTRDFIHVSDVVAHLLASMKQLEKATPPDAALNVCSGKAISINELAQTIATVCNQKTQIDYAPPRAGDIRFSCGDASLATATLGVQATIALADGLREILNAPKEHAA